MKREAITTERAPKAIGTYSQAIAAGPVVYLSGQIPIDPGTGSRVEGSFDVQLDRVLANLAAVCEAAGGKLDCIVKLTVYLADLSDFPQVNEGMARHFNEPYPARAAVQVAALPLGVDVEIDAIMQLPEDAYSY